MGLAQDAEWARKQAAACESLVRKYVRHPKQRARAEALREQWLVLADEIEKYLAGDPEVVQTQPPDDTDPLW